MSLPYEIMFHNMDKSEAVEARVREKVAHLEELYDRLTRCRVTIEAPHRNHRKGNRYQVRIVLDVPHGPLVVSHGPGKSHAHEDVYVAIRDSFSAATRQLEDYVRTRRGKVGRAGVIDDEALPGHPDFDGNLVQLALVVMTMRRLDGYAAPHDSVGKPLKAFSLFPDPCFDRVRPVHIPEDDFQGNVHLAIRSSQPHQRCVDSALHDRSRH